MKTRILLIAAGLASATPAQAATLFSNAPDLTFSQTGNCVYNTTCGSQISGNTFAAQLFTLASASTVEAFGFNAIVFGNVFGSAANFRVLSASAQNTPGALIASGTAALSHIAGPAGPSFATTDYSFNVNALQLGAGNYFLAFQNVTPIFSDYLSAGVAQSGAFQSDNGGVSYAAKYQNIGSVALSVSGEVLAAGGVPEPATWAMMIIGFGAVGGVMRRKSKVTTRVSFA